MRGALVFLPVGVVVIALTWVTGIVASLEAKPNLVLIIADDCTYRDMEVYGGQARTPHLKRLATEGMTFSRCFQAAPMCSPTRHCLYTGLYPVKSGAYPNHTFAHDWVRSIAHYFQAAGYRTHLSGKTHISPRSVFPFEYSKDRNNPDPVAIDKFFNECAADGNPFVLVACSSEPHTPYTKGDASVYPPATLKLPPVVADTLVTRRQFSKYLAEITYFDSQVGTILHRLRKHDLLANTLVMVLSEQGNAFPFAKWTCYDAGLQSGCIVRWPGKVEAGSRSDAIVEYVDVVPTFLDAAGLEIPEVLDGRSFLPVLLGKAKKHKDHAFGLHTTRGIINGSKHYGIRSVRDERYRLIINLTPEATFRNIVTSERDKVWQSWLAAAKDGDKRAAELVHAYQHRPAVEFYDCEADPWNRNNLAGDPAHAARIRALRVQLDAWMKAQGDEGQATELAALDRQARKRKKLR